MSAEAEAFYQRITKLGLNKQSLERILPDWWNEELFDNPASQALAEVYISRETGLTIAELRSGEKGAALGDDYEEYVPWIVAKRMIAEREEKIAQRYTHRNGETEPPGESEG